MPSSTVTFNGRVTLPSDVRNKLGLKTGDSVDFVEIDKGRFAIRHCSGATKDSQESREEAEAAAQVRD